MRDDFRVLRRALNLWNDLVEGQLYGLLTFLFEVDLHRLRERIARLEIPLLSLAFVRSQPNCLARCKMKLLVDVEDGLHEVVSLGNIGKRVQRISKGLRVHADVACKGSAVESNIHTESLRGLVLFVHLHSRLTLVALAEHNDQVPVQRVSGRNGDFDLLSDRRYGREKQGGGQEDLHGVMPIYNNRLRKLWPDSVLLLQRSFGSRRKR